MSVESGSSARVRVVIHLHAVGLWICNGTLDMQWDTECAMGHMDMACGHYDSPQSTPWRCVCMWILQCLGFLFLEATAVAQFGQRVSECTPVACS